MASQFPESQMECTEVVDSSSEDEVASKVPEKAEDQPMAPSISNPDLEAETADAHLRKRLEAIRQTNLVNHINELVNAFEKLSEELPPGVWSSDACRRVRLAIEELHTDSIKVATALNSSTAVVAKFSNLLDVSPAFAIASEEETKKHWDEHSYRCAHEFSAFEYLKDLFNVAKDKRPLPYMTQLKDRLKEEEDNANDCVARLKEAIAEANDAKRHLTDHEEAYQHVDEAVDGMQRAKSIAACSAEAMPLLRSLVITTEEVITRGALGFKFLQGKLQTILEAEEKDVPPPPPEQAPEPAAAAQDLKRQPEGSREASPAKKERRYTE